MGFDREYYNILKKYTHVVEDVNQNEELSDDEKYDIGQAVLDASGNNFKPLTPEEQKEQDQVAAQGIANFDSSLSGPQENNPDLEPYYQNPVAAALTVPTAMMKAYNAQTSQAQQAEEETTPASTSAPSPAQSSDPFQDRIDQMNQQTQQWQANPGIQQVGGSSSPTQPTQTTTQPAPTAPPASNRSYTQQYMEPNKPKTMPFKATKAY
jgi:hypothetical protein